MLVLSRKKKQSIIISDNIEITIVEISDDQVKLGINAPREVSIHRSEIYEKIKREMKAAAASHPAALDASVLTAHAPKVVKPAAELNTNLKTTPNPTANTEH